MGWTSLDLDLSWILCPIALNNHGHNVWIVHGPLDTCCWLTVARIRPSLSMRCWLSLSIRASFCYWHATLMSMHPSRCTINLVRGLMSNGLWISNIIISWTWMDLDITPYSVDWSWSTSREIGPRMDISWLDLDSNPVPGLFLVVYTVLLLRVYALSEVEWIY
jgi:hypothetical protein